VTIGRPARHPEDDEELPALVALPALAVLDELEEPNEAKGSSG
jgi:hypothetical protein